MESQNMTEKCFAYNECYKRCNILTELLCVTKGKCNFYKPESKVGKYQKKSLEERLKEMSKRYYEKNREKILLQQEKYRKSKKINAASAESPTMRSINYYKEKKKLLNDNSEKFEYQEEEINALNKELKGGKY